MCNQSPRTRSGGFPTPYSKPLLSTLPLGPVTAHHHPASFNTGIIVQYSNTLDQLEAKSGKKWPPRKVVFGYGNGTATVQPAGAAVPGRVVRGARRRSAVDRREGRGRAGRPRIAVDGLGDRRDGGSARRRLRWPGATGGSVPESGTDRPNAGKAGLAAGAETRRGATQATLTGNQNEGEMGGLPPVCFPSFLFGFALGTIGECENRLGKAASGAHQNSVFANFA